MGPVALRREKSMEWLARERADCHRLRIKVIERARFAEKYSKWDMCILHDLGRNNTAESVMSQRIARQ